MYWQKNGGKVYSWFKPAENDAVTVMCSASPEFEIRPILEKLGVQYIIGTQVDTKTGKFITQNCKGEEKVRRIKEQLGEVEVRNAYTDNIKSDAPMLSLAENKYMIKNGEIVKI
ncbi:MAG: haloacid dehalogenase-like hydrolase [Clostridia bacterium]|nr:haloacid dehalogenase-like hydrolase [Clostridia bacterium]